MRKHQRVALPTVDAHSLEAHLEALQSHVQLVVNLFASWDLLGSGTVDRREFRKCLHAVMPDADYSACDALFDAIADDAGDPSQHEEGWLQYSALPTRLRKHLDLTNLQRRTPAPPAPPNRVDHGALSPRPRRHHDATASAQRLLHLQEAVPGRAVARQESRRDVSPRPRDVSSSAASSPRSAAPPANATVRDLKLPPLPTLPRTLAARHRRNGARLPLSVQPDATPSEGLPPIYMTLRDPMRQPRAGGCKWEWTVG